MKTLSSKHSQSGFGHVVLLALLLVVAAVGLIGYKIYGDSSKNNSESTLTTKQPAQATNMPTTTPEIRTASDLDAASVVLDKNDPSTTSSDDISQLNSETKDLN